MARLDDGDEVRIVLNGDTRRMTFSGVFFLPVDGQALIVGTFDIGPFDTWQDFMVRVGGMVARSLGPLNR